jgi:diguanylate cyclase (GGDEF)-like protein
MVTAVRIAFLIYASIPVYVAAVLLYRRPPFHWYSTGLEVGLVGVMVACTWLDLLRLRTWRVDALRPRFSFFQIVVAITTVLVVNLTAGGLTGTYYVLFLLPVVVAAVVGSRRVLALTWVLCLGALGAVLVARHVPGADTIAWTIAVHAAAWGVTGAAVHLAVRQFVDALRTSDALAELATAAGAEDSWPAGIAPCLPILARAVHADHVAVFAAAAGEPLGLVAGDGETATRTLVEVARRVRDGGLPLATGRWTLAPSRSQSGTDIVVAVSRRPASTTLRVGTSDLRAAAVMTAQLLAGLADRASLIEGLRTAAATDPLTGLPNRRFLGDLLARSVAQASRSRRPLSVAIVDADHFKDVNDHFGHLAGDRVLQALAAALVAGVRRSDVVARYGGEEFCLVLPDTDEGAARVLAEDLRHRVGDALAELVRGTIAPAAASPSSAPSGHQRGAVGALPERVTISTGVAQWFPGESAEHVVARADRALYRAKQSGRDAVVVDPVRAAS